MVELLGTVLRKLYTAFPLSDTARPPEAQKLQQVGLTPGLWYGSAAVLKTCMLVSWPRTCAAPGLASTGAAHAARSPVEPCC